MRSICAHHPPYSLLTTCHHFSPPRFASQAVLPLPLPHDLDQPQQDPAPAGCPATTTTTLQQAKNSFSSAAHAQKALISLIKSCTHKAHLLQIHAYLFRSSLFQDPFICQAFLSRVSFSPFRDLRYSNRIISQILEPNVFVYGTVIRAYSISHAPAEGFELYREMIRRGTRPDPVSSSFAAKICSKICDVFGGLQIHGRIWRDGHQSESLLLTTLMDMYSNFEKSDDAYKVFDEIPHRDTVAWNVLISCYIRNGRTRDALGLFHLMQSKGCESEPDDVTCLLVIQACAALNALEFGQRVHSYIVERGYGGAVNLCNAVVAMYSRCGCLDKAYEVFKSIPNKDVVSWSSMISGLARNGYGRDAIEAFREMQREGVAPDEQTFTGILSACSHSGLLHEGQVFFDCMSKEFGIMPNVHHYGCMVDLLGRVGLLHAAYDLILSMRVKPDATIWRTLLGACRIHGHVDLGERVIGHLIELKAQAAGDYVLLLNIYSSVGNWEKVTEVRKLMKENGIQTMPGCSTIEFKGEVHEFIADDVSHPQRDEVYEMLDEIGKQLKIAGYVAEITSELHNVGIEDKKSALSYHSEKLAIAFGVLATPPGTTIRVAKNLRTCVDCHNFAKILSAVYNREVIVRDRTRFHHFREGRCSCNDFW